MRPVWRRGRVETIALKRQNDDDEDDHDRDHCGDKDAGTNAAQIWLFRQHRKKGVKLILYAHYKRRKIEKAIISFTRCICSIGNRS